MSEFGLKFRFDDAGEKRKRERERERKREDLLERD